MASGKSIGNSKAILDAELKNGTPYLTLCTTAGGAPSGSAGGVELAGNSYGRAPMTFGSATGTATGSATTTADTVFPATTADMAACSYFEIWSALSGGTRLRYGVLPVAVTPLNGLPVIVPVGGIVVTES